MAEETTEESGAPAPKAPKDPHLILALGNVVLVLVALGATVYTKFLFKRPVVVESTEVAKKKEEASKPVETPVQPKMVHFEQMMVNIAMTSGKAHYVTISWTIECRDPIAEEEVKVKRDLIIDKLITLLGKRQITELNTIQGKILLKTELLKDFNQIVRPGAILDLHFSNFILQ